MLYCGIVDCLILFYVEKTNMKPQPKRQLNSKDCEEIVVLLFVPHILDRFVPMLR